jgi:hypothetical protein
VALMAEAARNRIGNCKTRISVEVEKLGRNYDPILPHVDVIFVSKEFAISKGKIGESESATIFTQTT